MASEPSIKTTSIKVLHLSTHDEDCGIGKYQEEFLRQLAGDNVVVNMFYPTSPNIIKKLSGATLEEELHRFTKMLADFDILHIQHEFGFFHGDGEGLGQFIDIAKNLNKKIVITIHTAPSLVYKPVALYAKSLRGWAGYAKRTLKNKSIKKKRLDPFKQADLIITLNSHTTNELVNLVGVDQSRIHQTRIPVEKKPSARNKHKLRKAMGAADQDIILATIGFLSDKKGVDDAVRALDFLPKKYKLAILGGVNPEGGNRAVYDTICDLIVERKLQDRVYISGFIKDDKLKNELVSDADIALYPYDVEYYRLASSAAINDAIANSIPVIAYPTQSFLEINKNTPGTLLITQTDNYYELAKGVRELDAQTQLKHAEEYARKNSLENLAKELVGLYQKLIA